MLEVGSLGMSTGVGLGMGHGPTPILSSRPSGAPLLQVEASFPEAFQGLFEPHRYKVFYGGRGGAKSWAFARALLLEGMKRQLKVLCAREFQNSIADSVHQLLTDQILKMSLEGFYSADKTTIWGKNGTTFIFEGIKQNVSKIKSYEGIDICWVEEARNVSKSSWDILIPTIRKEGSEIWISFNPELTTDETYQRFVVFPPSGALSRFVTWRDNKWFPNVLMAEMLDLKARDHDSYLHVWEGQCRQVLEGAVYAKELALAEAERRICRVPCDKTRPVDTFWDLGRSDSTSIWLAQVVGFEFRFLEYYESSRHHISHYVEWLQERGQAKGYIWGTDWLPHDAKAKQLGSQRTIEEQLRGYVRRVKIVKKLSVADGINAARGIFPNCWFDAADCADGLQCLRNYQYEQMHDGRSFSQNPLHNWASHGADAFRYAGVALRAPLKRAKLDLVERGAERVRWMEEGAGLDWLAR